MAEQLRRFERVMAYVQNINPDYEYKWDDFGVQASDNVFTLYRWKLEGIPEPTDADLMAITEQKIRNTEKKIKDDVEAKDPLKVIKKLVKRIEDLEAKVLVLEGGAALK